MQRHKDSILGYCLEETSKTSSAKITRERERERERERKREREREREKETVCFVLLYCGLVVS